LCGVVCVACAFWCVSFCLMLRCATVLVRSCARGTMSGAPHRSKMLQYINTAIVVSLTDGRKMAGTFLAYDKFMNVVLSDAVETKEGKGGELHTRELGLVLLRGDHVASITTEAGAAKAARKAPAGVPGAGSAVPAGRGAGSASKLPGKGRLL
jgi:small nuclear ribonucleoprotein B and B'